MSPDWATLNLLAVVGPDVVEPRAVLFLVALGVVHPAPGLELARVDPDEREVAVLVVGDLEDEPAERFVGAGLRNDLGPPLGVVADDGGRSSELGR